MAARSSPRSPVSETGEVLHDEMRGIVRETTSRLIKAMTGAASKRCGTSVSSSGVRASRGEAEKVPENVACTCARSCARKARQHA